MTSNLGSDLIQSMSEGPYEEMRNAVMEVVRQSFRPEFINRIDDSVVFHPLDRSQIHGIARIQLETLISRVKESQIVVEFDDSAIEILVGEGYDPVYGARPLKRAIQRYVENPLSEAILSGNFAPGEQIVALGDEKSVFFQRKT